jgi:hypothetical protein
LLDGWGVGFWGDCFLALGAGWAGGAGVFLLSGGGSDEERTDAEQHRE